MDNKELTPEMIAALKRPLPAEAISQHPTRKYLSSIKAIYVVERLNEVFGLGKWFQKNEVIPTEKKMKIVHSFLTIPEYGIELDNFGGNDNDDEGDALKGAATDALTKMASYLYIGMDVYKGMAHETPVVKNSQAQTTKRYAPSQSRKPTEKQVAFISKLCKEKGVNQSKLKELAIGKNPSQLIEALIALQVQDLPVIQQEMTPEEQETFDNIPF